MSTHNKILIDLDVILKESKKFLDSTKPFQGWSDILLDVLEEEYNLETRLVDLANKEVQCGTCHGTNPFNCTPECL